MEFCPKCDMLMHQVFAPDGLIFNCLTCGFTKPASDSSTLIRKGTTCAGTEQYQFVTDTILDDQANPIERIYCNQCKCEVLARYIRLPEILTKKYECPAGHIFP